MRAAIAPASELGNVDREMVAEAGVVSLRLEHLYGIKRNIRTLIATRAGGRGLGCEVNMWMQAAARSINPCAIRQWPAVRQRNAKRFPLNVLA